MRPRRRRRVMMKVEGTENDTEKSKDDDCTKGCDSTDDIFSPHKVIKSEDENNSIPDEENENNKIHNHTNSSRDEICDGNPSENGVPVDTKVEELSENERNHDSSQSSNKVLNNNQHMEDTKTPFKICRLCLVFVDDNFIPLDKVMVMLQIVLPEVVSTKPFFIE